MSLFKSLYNLRIKCDPSSFVGWFDDDNIDIVRFAKQLGQLVCRRIPSPEGFGIFTLFCEVEEHQEDTFVDLRVEQSLAQAFFVPSFGMLLVMKELTLDGANRTVFVPQEEFRPKCLTNKCRWGNLPIDNIQFVINKNVSKNIVYSGLAIVPH
jgi:hypothetical protein